MRKLVISSLAVATAMLGSTAAQAGVVICGGTGLPNCPNVSTNNVLITSGTGATILGSTQGGQTVTYTGNESLTGAANGQATVGATDNLTNFLNLVFSGAGFTYAEFNVFPSPGNVQGEATSITITYYTPSGASQTVTIGTNGENRLGIYGTAGETFTRLSFETNPNTTTFQDLRQLRIQEAVAAVPEPGTWAMMLLGFGAVGFGLRRRRTDNLRMQIA